MFHLSWNQNMLSHGQRSFFKSYQVFGKYCRVICLLFHLCIHNNMESIVLTRMKFCQLNLFCIFFNTCLNEVESIAIFKYNDIFFILKYFKTKAYNLKNYFPKSYNYTNYSLIMGNRLVSVNCLTDFLVGAISKNGILQLRR